MNWIALATILIYQKYISPFKGFSCAYRAYTGQLSCSAHGYKSIERYGIFIGLKLIRRRLKKCRLKYRNHVSVIELEKNRMVYMRHQAGFCDADCDIGVCDIIDLGSCACDGLSDCDLDFGKWKRRKKDDLKYDDMNSDSKLN
jgi:putative component of membrane protein insertase Oxa1/YidC/SpoIIIJ protein YidD